MTYQSDRIWGKSFAAKTTAQKIIQYHAKKIYPQISAKIYFFATYCEWRYYNKKSFPQEY